MSTFDPHKNYDWVIASANTAITGFDPTAFAFNTSSFTNNTGIGNGSFSIIQGGSIAGTTNKDVVLVFAGGAVSSVWSPDGAGNWSVASNWTNNSVPNGIGDTATFGNTALTAPRNVTVDGAFTVGTIAFNAAGTSNGFTLATDGVGGHGLTLNNNGIGASITVSNGSQVISAPMTLADNLTVIPAGSSTLTLSGIINETGGARTLTMNGAGTLVLSASNTYSGLTTISAGTLAYGASNVIGTGPVTVNGSTAVLDLGANHTDSVGTVTLDGLGTITGTGSSTLTSTGSFEMKSGSVSVILDGSGIVLNKTTAGNVTLSGNNTYTGGTNINGGLLTLGSAGALGTTGTISFGGGTLQYSASNTTDYSSRFSTAASQAYSIDTNSQTVTFASALTSSGGTLAKLGNGTLILTGANSYNTTTITAGTLQIGNGGTSGSLGTGNVTDNGTLAFNRSDSITIGNLISGSTGGLSQIGSGTLTLNTSNTFVGAVTISGGTLSTNNVADTGVASGIGTGANGAITLSGGGTFQYLGGTASTSRLITMSSSATLDASGSGAINFTRTGILAKLVVGTASTTVTLTGSNTGLNALRERISNPSIGTTSLVKNGSGTWDLAAASNTYSGTTTISQGILEVDADAALGTSAGGTSVSGTGAELRLGNVSYTTAEP